MSDHPPDLPPQQPAPAGPPSYEQHLNVLSILYYIWGGLNALFGCFATIYIVMGAVFLKLPPEAYDEGEAPPPLLGGLMMCGGITMLLLLLALAALFIGVGRSIAQRRRYLFCIVMAAIACLSIPFGTALGVYTIVILTRPDVRAAFNRPTATFP